MKNGKTPPERDRLRYGILGEDGMTDEEKLAKFSGQVDWNYLKPHFEAGALLYVDPSLDLKEVGVAFSGDEKERVEAWLKTGDLVKPSQPHATYWEASKAVFTAMVVSPFVLIQPTS
ncbi:MAG: DUF2288 domain-containing protein [Verrucomicrobiota bacterium]